jgi:hypothetical protein
MESKTADFGRHRLGSCTPLSKPWCLGEKPPLRYAMKSTMIDCQTTFIGAFGYLPAKEKFMKTPFPSPNHHLSAHRLSWIVLSTRDKPEWSTHSSWIASVCQCLQRHGIDYYFSHIELSFDTLNFELWKSTTMRVLASWLHNGMGCL